MRMGYWRFLLPDARCKTFTSPDPPLTAMVSKCARIPISVSFESGYPHKEIFLKHLHLSGAFMVCVPLSEYYSEIRRILLSDCDPFDYIQSHEPIIDSTPSFDVLVACSPSEHIGFTFPFVPASTDSEFNTRISEITESIRIRWMSAFDENSGFNFYRKYLGMSTEKRKVLAEAYFFLGSYQESAGLFRKLKKAWPAYAIRMESWCNLMLGSAATPLPHIFDILMLNNRFDLLFESASSMNDDIRGAILYWLSGKPLPASCLLLVDYACLLNLTGLENSPKLEQLRGRMGSKIENIKNIPAGTRKQLWNEVSKNTDSERRRMIS